MDIENIVVSIFITLSSNSLRSIHIPQLKIKVYQQPGKGYSSITRNLKDVTLTRL